MAATSSHSGLHEGTRHQPPYSHKMGASLQCQLWAHWDFPLSHEPGYSRVSVWDSIVTLNLGTSTQVRGSAEGLEGTRKGPEKGKVVFEWPSK
jgi:hypothetical protein